MATKDWESYFDALRKQDWQTARTALQRVVKDEKRNPQVHLKMGDLLQRLGETAGAIEAYHCSARLLVNDGFNQKAIALYKIILRLDPRNAEAIRRSEFIIEEMENAKGRRQMFQSPVSSEEAVGALSVAPTVSQPLAEPPQVGDWLEPTSAVGTPESFGTPSARTPVPQGNEPVEGEDWLAPTSLVSDVDMQHAETLMATPLSERRAITHIPELFSDMTEEEYALVLDEFDVLKFSDGQIVVEEGDSGDSMYIVKKGEAKVVAHLLGKILELAILTDGDVFGEVAFLTGRPRTASVIASGQLEVYEVSRLKIEQIIEQNPDILSKLEYFYEDRVKATIRKVKGG